MDLPGEHEETEEMTEPREYTNPNGTRWLIECVGYVAGTKYNSEGKIIDWLLNKHGCWHGYRPDTYKVCKTEKQARNLLNKHHGDDPTGYIREFFRHTQLLGLGGKPL